MKQKRKSKLNRHSLSMVENSLIGIGGGGSSHANINNTPFYTSNVSLSLISSNNKI